MFQLTRSLIIFSFLLVLIGAALPVAAQQENAGAAAIRFLNIGQLYGTGTDEPTSVPQVAADVISIALSLIGIVFIGIVIYGGYLWGTARGSEERVEQGRKLIFEAVIGIIIIFGAYFLTAFVVQKIGQATFTPSEFTAN